MVSTEHKHDTKTIPTTSNEPLGLGDLAQRAPRSVVTAAAELLKIAAEDQDKAPFVERGLRAVADIAEASTKRSLLGAAGAASDTLALLEALDSPEALGELRQDDPLLAARVRGALAKRRLLSEEGGACSAEQFGELLGHLTRQAVDKRRRRGRLIALDLGRHGYAYPLWQIHDGALLPGLEKVLAVLHECDPWTQVSFMLSPSSWLGGATPLAELRRGEIEPVVATAEMFAE